MTTDPQVHNPVSIEQAIQETGDRIEASVKVVADRFEEYQKAKALLDEEKAQAALSYEGSDAAKRNYSIVVTAELRKDADRKYEAYKYAQKLAEALGDKLRALQSVNKSVRDAYNSSGWRR